MTRVRRALACRRAAGSLRTIAEGRVADPRSLAALEHLGTCPRCRREAERLALLVHQLRRLAAVELDAAAAVALPDRSWEAVRARIERGRTDWQVRASRWRADLGGLLLSVVVVAAAVGPLAAHAPIGGGEAEPTGGDSTEWDRQAWLIEVSYDAGRRPASTTLAAEPATTLWSGPTTIPRSVPDSLLPIGKEVPFDRASGQPAATVDRAVGPS